MAASIVGSRVNYCNALLYDAGQSVFDKFYISVETGTLNI